MRKSRESEQRSRKQDYSTKKLRQAATPHSGPHAGLPVKPTRRAETLHAVASKHFLTAFAQSGPVLLQALLNRIVICQLLAAEALCISPAGLLLLWRAHVTLRKR